LALSVERLEALAAASFDAAMNESFSPELRDYYARLALWADSRAKKLAEK
jgi:hypothetical protein